MKIIKGQNESDFYEAELARIGNIADSGQYDDAVTEYTLMITKFGDSPRLAALRGHALYRLGNYVDAITDLQSASDKVNEASNTLFILGKCYAEVEQLDQALKCFKRIVDSSPTTSDAYTEMGLILKYRGDIAASSSMLSKALAINPDDELAKSMLADLEELQ